METPVRIEVEVEIVVPFQDCDPMGVAWHGNYFRYLEAARSALLNKLEYNYDQMTASGYAWPVVDTRVKFVRPTRYGDRLRVRATLVEYENRLKIDYEIRDSATGQRVTRAHTTQVAVEMEKEEICFCSPQELIDKVRACARSG